MEFRVTSTLVWLFLLGLSSFSLAEKLSPDQKAPPFAKGSGGLALAAPYQGGPRAADVGQRMMNPVAAPAASAQGGGAYREENVRYKDMSGRPVRTVMGKYGWVSPEGTPVEVKYSADENGNHAGFKLGKAVSGDSGSSAPPKPELTPGGSSATSLNGSTNGKNGSAEKGGSAETKASNGDGGGGNGESKGPNGGGGSDSTYLPPDATTKPSRRYLPPNK